jgi:hypothetical protein
VFSGFLEYSEMDEVQKSEIQSVVHRPQNPLESASTVTTLYPLPDFLVSFSRVNGFVGNFHINIIEEISDSGMASVVRDLLYK